MNNLTEYTLPSGQPAIDVEGDSQFLKGSERFSFSVSGIRKINALKYF
jgi:hypothetical protein